ncbi:glycosyltransferase family 4 protein [Desulfonatronospira sp.]|uniref:glycosyltransferase family 4 protein n=1 Tax=Desulfonatronospira sp. TaxID=1962951 RepID=UPI0025B85C8E|nr:glycosyltransferase family 4 protein [Desulfonatronospira sp.]
MTKILVLDRQSPFPVQCGHTLRVFHLSRELSKRHTCFAAFFPGQHVNSKLDNSGLNEVFAKTWHLSAMDGKVSWKRFLYPLECHLAKRFNPEFWKRVRKEIYSIVIKEKIDAVLICGIGMAQYLEGISVGRKILDICDSSVLTRERRFGLEPMASTGAWLRRNIYLCRAKRAEHNVSDKFDAVTVVSPADLHCLLQRNRNKDNIYLVPNGVDMPYQKGIGISQERAVIFWGVLSFSPNSTAIRFFLEHVWPLIKEQDIRWYIVGKNPPTWLQQAAHEHKGIELTGFVDDLPGFAASVPIMVNPMQIGSGIKNKVLEAFALQRAVISTTLGMEAIQAQPGVHYLRAETGPEFAEAIIKLLDNPELCIELGTAARKLVAEHYTWEKAGQTLEALFRIPDKKFT